MGYEPKGRTKNLIDAMRAVSDERPIWTKQQCAEVMEIPVAQVPAYLMRAIDHGLIRQRNVAGGKPEYSLKPFPPLATPAPQPPREHYVPPQMRAPREGSDVHHVNPPGGTAPLVTGPAAAADARAVSTPAPTPTPAPAPAPTPAPAPVPVPPITAPAAADASIRDGVPLGSLPDQEEEDVHQPDAWISCRTGAIVLTGIEADEDGAITIPPDLVAEIKRQLAWSPLR